MSQRGEMEWRSCHDPYGTSHKRRGSPVGITDSRGRWMNGTGKNWRRDAAFAEVRLSLVMG